jgi:hypothetical protein
MKTVILNLRRTGRLRSMQRGLFRHEPPRLRPRARLCYERKKLRRPLAAFGSISLLAPRAEPIPEDLCLSSVL